MLFWEAPFNPLQSPFSHTFPKGNTVNTVLVLNSVTFFVCFFTLHKKNHRICTICTWLLFLKIILVRFLHIIAYSSRKCIIIAV